MRYSVTAVLIMLAVSATACSANSSSSDSLAPAPAVKRVRIEPPRLLRGEQPRIREEYDAKIEVMIDKNGEPDMQSLKISGRVGGSARLALESWIQYSSFVPARRDGVPVAGLFVMRMTQTIR